MNGSIPKTAAMLDSRPRPDLVPAELLDRLVRYFDPQAVILFGSRARGDGRADSDYDLLVVLADTAPPEKRTLRAGREAREGWHGAADIIPCPRSWFDDKRDVVNSLAWIADTEGVVLYGGT